MKYLLLMIAILLSSEFLAAQIMSASSQVGFQVRTGEGREVSQKVLKDAKTIGDIHLGYPSSWISSYISMEVMTNFKGVIKNAVSMNDTLSDEQWMNLSAADIGTEVTLRVQYVPKNDLEEKEEKELVYNYMVAPEIQAGFPGGDEALNAYLQNNAVDKLTEEDAIQLKWNTVTFDISENGEVINVALPKSTGIERIDKLLIKTIQNMPSWTPAQNLRGQSVSQKFELNIGSQFGC